MRSKRKTLFILLAVCLSLVLCVVLLLTLDSCAEDDAGSISSSDHVHSDEEEDAAGMLVNVDVEELEQLVLTNEHGTFTFRHNAKTELIEIAELADLPVVDSYIEYAWYAACYVSYSYTIEAAAEQPLELSQFGLEQPQVTMDVAFTDGTSNEIYIGNAVPTLDGYYYLTQKDDSNVYVGEVDVSVFEGASYFLDTDIFAQIDDSTEIEIGKITITGSEIDKKIVLEPYSTDDVTDQSYGDDYIITSPVRAATNDSNVTSLVTELAYLTAQEVTCDHPTKTELKKYGLDNPRVRVRFERNGTEYFVNCGTVDENSFYITIDGIDAIYNIEPTSAPILSAPTLDTLRTGDIRVYTIEGVEAITVQTAQDTYRFKCNRTIRSEADNDVLYEYHAYCGETELNLTWYRNFLSVLSGASAVNRDTDGGSSAAVRVTVEYFDGVRADDVLEYCADDSRRYVVYLNGKPQGKVTAVWLRRMLSAAQALAAGESVSA